MNLSAYLETAVLNWACTTAAVTRPTAWYLGLATAIPTATTGNEITGDVGYARQIITFAAATSIATYGVQYGFTSNTNTLITFGPFSNLQTIYGIQVWDSLTGGNMLFFDTLTMTLSVTSGNEVTLMAGNLQMISA